jgi:hypothetical protein
LAGYKLFEWFMTIPAGPVVALADASSPENPRVYFDMAVDGAFAVP